MKIYTGFVRVAIETGDQYYISQFWKDTHVFSMKNVNNEMLIYKYITMK